MISVEQLLAKKANQLWTISKDATVFECIEYMEEKNVGALFVMDGDAMVGIISERDYARKIVLKDRTSKETKVEDIMTKKVFTTNLKTNIDECLVLMNEKYIRHLPVLDNDKLVGMISVGDVVKEIIEEQQYTIRCLEDNISWAESY